MPCLRSSKNGGMNLSGNGLKFAELPTCMICNDYHYYHIYIVRKLINPHHNTNTIPFRVNIKKTLCI